MNKHGGNLRELSVRSGFNSSDILDFSVNLNPFGPPSWLQDELLAAVPLIEQYPDPESTLLREAASKRWNSTKAIKADSIVCSNGSDELFKAAAAALDIQRVLVPVPSYASYCNTGLPTVPIHIALNTEAQDYYDQLDRSLLESGPKTLLVLGWPNNPDGRELEQDLLLKLADRHPASWLLVDEAFRDFIDDRTFAEADRPNILITRSLTKFWSIPGLRAGFAICPPETAAAVRKELSEWPMNSFAERIGVRAMQDQKYIEKTRAGCIQLREELEKAAAAINGIRVASVSRANFVLLGIKDLDSGTIESSLLKKGIAVRNCTNFPGLDSPEEGYIRIAVRKKEDTTHLLQELKQLIGHS